MASEQEVSAIKQLLDLERRKEDLQHRLQNINAEVYSVAAPQAPGKRTVERVYPEVKSAIPFNYVLAFAPVAIMSVIDFITMIAGYSPAIVTFLLFFSVLWIPVYYFAFLKRERAQDVERIKASDEYRLQCAELDRQYDGQQALFDQEFAAQQAAYGRELEQYKAEEAAWHTDKEEREASAAGELREVSQELSSLYDESRIIPVQYRNLEAVSNIYATISSSAQDVAAAIVSYEALLQRQRLAEQTAAAEAMASAQFEQAAAQREANEIADRARKEQNLANLANWNEQRKRNKIMKNW